MVAIENIAIKRFDFLEAAVIFYNEFFFLFLILRHSDCD